MTTAIECRGVTKRFGRVVALDGLEFTVPRGAVAGYIGPNGAGKSTTIRILLDLARRDSGEVRVLGADPRTAGPELRRRIGYLPGELRLDERLRVDETLRTWSRLRGGVDPAAVDDLCRRLGLDTARSTKGLSTGNRRKVGLVGAFMGRPEVLILDEPTAGVDPLVQAEILDLIADARDTGQTVFLSSHVLSDVQRVADFVIVIRAGRVVATGDVDELRRATRQEFKAWFAGPPPEAALRGTPGVTGVEVRGTEARGYVDGETAPLLRTLAAADVAHLVLPEPDLEQAFLGFFDGGDGEG